MFYDEHNKHVKVLQLISHRVSDEKSVFTAAALAAGASHHGGSATTAGGSSGAFTGAGAGTSGPGGKRLPNSTSSGDLFGLGGALAGTLTSQYGATSFGLNISLHSGLGADAADAAGAAYQSGVLGGVAIPGALDTLSSSVFTNSGHGDGHSGPGHGDAPQRLPSNATSSSLSPAYTTTVTLRDDRIFSHGKPDNQRYFENFSTIRYEYHLWVPQTSRFQPLQQQFWQFAPEYFGIK